MRAAVAVLAALTLATGCGGSNAGSGTASSAGLLKPGALAYWQTVSDPDSPQWEQVEKLLGKFPDSEQWIAQLKRELEKEGVTWEGDVRPALGSVVDLAVYAAAGSGQPSFVGLTNPKDKDKLLALVDKLEKQGDDPVVTRSVDDWVVISTTEAAIDAALKDGDDSLADDQGFKSAMEELPEDALTRFYVDPSRLAELAGPQLGKGTLRMLGLDGLDFAGGWAKAKEAGAELSLALRGQGVDRLLGSGEPYASKLLDHVPEEAFAFVSFRGEGLSRQFQQLRSNPLFARGIREFEQEAGVDVDQIVSLLDGEVAFFVHPGAPTAAFTLLLESDDPDRDKVQLDRLLRLLPEEIQVEVGTLSDGVVAVSTATNPFEGIAPGDRLADSERFSEALDAAGAPDEYTGLAYVDLKEATGVILSYLGISGDKVPGATRRNLEPLDTLVAYGTKDGDLASVRVFVGID